LAHRLCPTTPPAQLHAHTRCAVDMLPASRAPAHFAWFRLGAAPAGVHHVFDWSPNRLAGCPSVAHTSFILATLGAEVEECVVLDAEEGRAGPRQAWMWTSRLAVAHADDGPINIFLV
jgi:hypothetical protein